MCGSASRCRDGQNGCCCNILSSAFDLVEKFRINLDVKVHSLYVIQLLLSSVNFRTLNRAELTLGSIESILAMSGLITYILSEFEARERT